MLKTFHPFLAPMELSCEDLLRNAIAEDIAPGNLSTPGCPAGTCYVCGSHATVDPLLLHCAIAHCGSIIHAACIQRGLQCESSPHINWTNGRLTYVCPTHCSQLPQTDNYFIEFVAAMDYLFNLTASVSCVLQSIANGTASVDSMQDTLAKLVDAKSAPVIIHFRFIFCETMRLLESWERRLRREVDRCADFKEAVEKLERDIVKLSNTVNLVGDESLNLLSDRRYEADLISVLYCAKYALELEPRAGSPSVDLESCEKVVSNIIGSIDIIKNLRSGSGGDSVKEALQKLCLQSNIFEQISMCHSPMLKILEHVRDKYAEQFRKFAKTAADIDDTFRTVLKLLQSDHQCNISQMVGSLQDNLVDELFACQESRVLDFLASVAALVQKCDIAFSDESRTRTTLFAAEGHLRNFKSILLNDKVVNWAGEYLLVEIFCNVAKELFLKIGDMIDTSKSMWEQIIKFMNDAKSNTCQVNLEYFEVFLNQTLATSLVDVDTRDRALQLIQLSRSCELRAKHFLVANDTLGSIFSFDSCLKCAEVLKSSRGILRSDATAEVAIMYSLVTTLRRAILGSGVNLPLMSLFRNPRNMGDSDAPLNNIIGPVSSYCWTEVIKCLIFSDGAPLESSYVSLEHGLVLGYNRSILHSGDADILNDNFCFVESIGKAVETTLSELSRLFDEVDCVLTYGAGIPHRIAEMWSKMCKCSSLWLLRCKQVSKSMLHLSDLFCFQESSFKSSIFDTISILRAVRSARFLVTTISECCGIVLALQNYMERNRMSIPGDYLATQLGKAVVGSYLCNSGNNVGNLLLSMDYTFENEIYVTEFSRVEILVSRLTGLEDCLINCLGSKSSILSNIFCSTLKIVMSDIALECSSWKETVHKKFPGGIKRRKSRQRVVESVTAKSLEYLLYHPFPAVIRVETRSDLLQLYMEGRKVATQCRRLLLCSEENPVRYPLFRHGFDVSNADISSREVFPFSDAYDENGLSKFLNALCHDQDSMSVFPYYLAEMDIFRWAINAVIWLRDFCDAWEINSTGQDVVPYEACQKLRQSWNISAKLSPELIISLQDMKVLADGVLHRSFSSHVRAAVFLFEELDSRSIKLQELSDAAMEILANCHVNDGKNLLSSISIQMESLCIEPSRPIMYKIKEIVDPQVAAHLPEGCIANTSENLNNNKGLLSTVQTPSGSLKRKATDQAATLKSIVGGKRLLAVIWMSTICNDPNGDSSSEHHLESVSVPPAIDCFLSPIEVAYGLPLCRNTDRYHDSFLKFLVWQSLLSEVNCKSSSEIFDQPQLRITAARALSTLPNCSATLFGEKFEPSRGSTDFTWEKKREGVRTVLADIFIPLLLKGSIYDSITEDSFSSNTAAVARGTVLSTEIEEELYLFNIYQSAQKTQSLKESNYLRHSFSISQILSNNELLIKLLLSGERGVEWLVRTNSDDLISNSWAKKSTDDPAVISSSGPHEPYGSPAKTNQGYISSMEQIEEPNVAQINLTHHRQAVRKTLDLIKASSVPIHSDNVVTETSGISQMPRDYTHSNGAIEDAKLSEDRPLINLHDENGHHKLTFLWKSNISLSGFGAAHTEGLGSLRCSPFKFNMVIKGRLRVAELDKHLSECRCSILPFIFIMEGAMGSTYREFLNYLSGTHVSVCEEIASEKYWIYLIPPDLISTVRAAQTIESVNLCASFGTLCRTLPKLSPMSWFFGLYVHNSAAYENCCSPNSAYPISRFPPVELLSLNYSDIPSNAIVGSEAPVETRVFDTVSHHDSLSEYAVTEAKETSSSTLPNEVSLPALDPKYLGHCIQQSVHESIDESEELVGISVRDGTESRVSTISVESPTAYDFRMSESPSNSRDRQRSRSRSDDRQDILCNTDSIQRNRPASSKVHRSRPKSGYRSRSRSNSFERRRSRSRSGDRRGFPSRPDDRQSPMQSSDRVNELAIREVRETSGDELHYIGVSRAVSPNGCTRMSSVSDSDSDLDHIDDPGSYLDGLMTGTAPRVDSRLIKKGRARNSRR